MTVKHHAGRHVAVHGLRLFTDAFGRRRDRAALLINGMSAQMIAWDESFCEGLARRGYYVIRFDNRDTGLSTHFHDAPTPDASVYLKAWQSGGALPAPPPYRIEDLANDASGLLNALEIEKAFVIGSSLGGVIAQHLALRHPERVARLGLMMTTTGDPSLPPPQPEALHALLSKPAENSREAYLDHKVKTRRLLNGDRMPFNEEDCRARAAESYDRGLNPTGTARQIAAAVAAVGWKARLSEIRAPTVVIHGDRDPLFPLACGRDVAASIPHARLCVIEGMGHAMPVEIQACVIDKLTDETIGA